VSGGLHPLNSIGFFTSTGCSDVVERFPLPDGFHSSCTMETMRYLPRARHLPLYQNALLPRTCTVLLLRTLLSPGLQHVDVSYPHDYLVIFPIGKYRRPSSWHPRADPAGISPSGRGEKEKRGTWARIPYWLLQPRVRHLQYHSSQWRSWLTWT
jgi:hypothetical protein